MHMPIPDARTQMTKTSSLGIAIHDRAQDMPDLMLGPFIRLTTGELIAADERDAFISPDDGKSWTPHPLFRHDQDIVIRPERALIQTRNGTVILAFVNERERHFTWQDELRDAPGARLPTYAVRSLDNGRTWQDMQKLHDDWTGAVRDIAQTQGGRIVFTTMKMLSNPGRHTVLTYSSPDDGESWEASNVIDLGGNGHHGGVSEATLIELADGQLLKLIRTNWGQFWRAVSDDEGRSWHPLGPSGIPASSAPGMLLRMNSGRIALFWNRLYPEGENSYPLTGGDGLFSATPVSNHRGELSVSFSEDETQTWTAPVVIARKPGASLAYPYVFEVTPGILWVTTMQGGVRLKLREADLL